MNNNQTPIEPVLLIEFEIDDRYGEKYNFIVKSCFEIVCINEINRYVTIKILKNNTVNSKQIIDSVKSQYPNIDFTGFEFCQMI